MLSEVSMLSIGLLFALGSAFFESTLDVFRKKTAMAFDAITSAFVLHALTFVIALPFTIVVSFRWLAVPDVMQKIVHDLPTSSEFWFPLAASTVLNAIAVYLVMDALATADLGMVLPLTTLSPVFLLITAPLIAHEFPGPLGLTGILVTTLGTWGLARKSGQEGILKPFQLLWSQSSNRKMILVAVLYACSSPFDARAIHAGGPLWYLTFIDASLALVYTPFLFAKDRWRTLFSQGGVAKLFPLGLSNMFRAWCQFTALCYLIVPYAIGIKRLSVLLGIVWGRKLFNEKDTRQRLISASVMIVGSIMILYATVQAK